MGLRGRLGSSKENAATLGSCSTQVVISMDLQYPLTCHVLFGEVFLVGRYYYGLAYPFPSFLASISAGAHPIQNLRTRGGH